MIKITLIGEKCIDRFVYGEVNRLSPEAPVPVLNPIEIIENDGMSGNVLKNLHSLSDNIDMIHWYQEEKIIKTRYVEKKSNHMIVRVDEEPDSCIPFYYLDLEKQDIIKNSDIVIISDYKKGFLSDLIIEKIAQLSNFIVIDTKRKLTKNIIDNVDFIKLNYSEYLNNKQIVDENLNKFIITKGRDGTDYINKNYPSPNPQDTIDVSGAGDTFVASFSLKYFLTSSLDESIQYANLVCSDVVNKKGVSLPDKKFKLV